MTRFHTALNEQIAREFGASQQYVAIAVHYDKETLPHLAAHFYRQALDERNHAMMIVQYLLDADAATVIPGVPAPKVDFADAIEPVRLALAQERSVTEDIVSLAQLAREDGDLIGEQFLGWFLAEQREEVASMSSLLTLVERADQSSLLLVEDNLSRGATLAEEPATAPPPAAGGLL